MADNEEKVDETTTQDATEETNETTTTEEVMDYSKEFDEVVEKFETAEKNREGYLKRKEKTTEEQTDETVAQMDRIEEMVGEALKKQIPKLQSTLVEDTVEGILNEIASSDDEKKLIRLHFENSVGLAGTIRERLENAKLIANKKTILKTQKEMAIALNNRQGLSSTGQGTSTEGLQVQDNFFSQEQVASLKARGWDDTKIGRLKTNMRQQR